MMNTTLINIQNVTDFTDLSANVEASKYNQYIIMAQDRFLVEVIGKECLKGLVERTCDSTLTAEDTALLEYIKPYLVNHSYSLYVGSSMKISLKSGISNLTGDNATAIQQQSRVSESRKYILLAERYADDIIEYLEENTELYPCYVPKDDCTDSTSNYNIAFGL